VRYPAQIFKTVTGWRNFRSGEDPRTPVIPTQLFEAAGQLGIASLMFWLFWNQSAPSGRILPLWLLCYGALRFGVDFFRLSSTRPRIGSFSEAQVYSIAVSLGAAVILTFLK
jgi:prolipoprotein diacylglyceryltransferase